MSANRQWPCNPYVCWRPCGQVAVFVQLFWIYSGCTVHEQDWPRCCASSERTLGLARTPWGAGVGGGCHDVRGLDWKRLSRPYRCRPDSWNPNVDLGKTSRGVPASCEKRHSFSKRVRLPKCGSRNRRLSVCTERERDFNEADARERGWPTWGG